MAVDFKILLDKRLDDVKRPPPKPSGTYYGQTKRYELAESREKKTPYVRYYAAVTSPGDDVDPEMLREIDLSKWEPYFDFYITPDAEWRLKEFLVSCLGEDACVGRTFTSTIPEALNCPIIMAITQRASKDGKDIFNDVSSVKGRAQG